MRDRHGGTLRRTARLLLTLALVMLVGQALTADLKAQELTAGTWEQLTGGPSNPERLFAPTSGPLFAQAGLDQYRSDDGGNAWSSVTLPPTGTLTSRRIAVNPSSHQRIYANGADGLYRTVDDAASWSLAWPTDPDFPMILAIAPSPADQDLVYLLVRSKSTHLIRLLRSQDGGQSWTMIEQDGHEGLACVWVAYLFQAHPTDPDRLFRALDCHHALASSMLQESRDRGMSWTALVDAGGVSPETVQDPRGQSVPPVMPSQRPIRTGQIIPLPNSERITGGAGVLVGGEGAALSRFYLVVTKPDQGGGMSLLQTGDDGMTWLEQLSYTGGGGMTPANDTRPNVTVSSLVVDPGNPDRLYAAFHKKAKREPAVDDVRMSTDGGETWTIVGSGDPGLVTQLVLGIDSRNLYAATGTGVWRLSLSN